MKTILPEPDGHNVETMTQKVRAILDNPKYQFRYFDNDQQQMRHHEQLWVDKVGDRLKKRSLILSTKTLARQCYLFLYYLEIQKPI